MAKLAMAFGAGAGTVLAGAPTWMAPLVALVISALPKRGLRRPLAPWRFWILSIAAGAVAATATGGSTCLPRPTEGRVSLVGRFLAAPSGGSAPFVAAGACAPVTVVVRDTTVGPGVPVRVTGRWRVGERRPWFAAEPNVERAEGAAARVGWAHPMWLTARWRGRLVQRIRGLYGDRTPMVSALTLARREGLDPELREAFARSGLAHLLAISGFHVGVVAGMVLAFLRRLGVRRSTARTGSVLATWTYVAVIGFPDAAVRAALILALVALSTRKGRPPERWGALASAFLLLAVTDPSRLAGPGFQLSFAGAAGLVAWSSGLRRWIREAFRGRAPAWLVSALASGSAATFATLPVVAWHFGRLSVVGIPATLAAGPLVALALPGAILSVALDFVSHGAARFLAGGVDLLLEALELVVGRWASLPWASVWTTRPSVVLGGLGAVVGFVLARGTRIGSRTRRITTGMYMVAAVSAWPLLLRAQGLGTVEIVMIDVGQGDALAIRSPRGRWVLVDAGPPDRQSDPGAHPVVRALRARAVSRVEAVFLTHPDLDHTGGASDVLASFDVREVFDPGIASGKAAFVALLEEVSGLGLPWRAARRGDRLELDGLSLTVLHPSDSMATTAVESNAASVVLHLQYGSFDALLTGDADTWAERQFLDELPGAIEVLKVGHHGSDTSTDPRLLALARPELALISVGRRNRYGHPAPEVLDRLRRAEVPVRRTDLDGTLSLRARRDGRFTLLSGPSRSWLPFGRRR